MSQFRRIKSRFQHFFAIYSGEQTGLAVAVEDEVDTHHDDMLDVFCFMAIVENGTVRAFSSLADDVILFKTISGNQCNSIAVALTNELTTRLSQFVVLCFIIFYDGGDVLALSLWANLTSL